MSKAEHPRGLGEALSGVAPMAVLDVNYLIVKGHTPTHGTPFATNGMENVVPTFFFLPRNLLQLFCPRVYAAQSTAMSCVGPTRGSTFFLDGTQASSQIPDYLSKQGAQLPVHIVLFAEWSQPACDILMGHRGPTPPVLAFLETPVVPKAIRDRGGFASSPFQLVEALRSRVPDVLAWVAGKGFSLPPPVHEMLSLRIPECTDFQVPDFSVTYPLWGMINHHTGSMWREELAASNHDKSRRRGLVVDAVVKCDGLSDAAAYSRCNPSLRIDPDLPPLILSFPYIPSPWRRVVAGHLPDAGRALGLEQDLDYLYQNVTTKDMASCAGVLATMKSVREEADLVGFLHATLSWSPCVRLPEIGRSIAHNVSALEIRNQPSAGPDNKTLRSIQSFGERLARLTISDELRAQLLGVNRQLVLQSDLPAEWLVLDGVPASFLFDMCRIPYSPASAGLAEYAKHTLPTAYRVSPSTLANHLIASVCPDDMVMASTNRSIRALCDRIDMPFNRVECRSVDELRSTVRDRRPELLILDGHGGMDTGSGSPFLHVGNERLGREEVLSLDSWAPLVVLSCCNSAPVHSWNPLPSWFLQTGAQAVLATVLPVETCAAGVLYARILWNLRDATEHCMHRNWLAFIAHNVRTSVLGDAVASVARRFAASPSEMAPQRRWQAASMAFSGRPECFRTIPATVAAMYPHLDRNDIIRYLEKNMRREQLFYSLYGRADLVAFRIWQDAYAENMQKAIGGTRE